MYIIFVYKMARPIRLHDLVDFWFSRFFIHTIWAGLVAHMHTWMYEMKKESRELNQDIKQNIKEKYKSVSSLGTYSKSLKVPR